MEYSRMEAADVVVVVQAVADTSYLSSQSSVLDQ
jgi:hypothetical protein